MKIQKHLLLSFFLLFTSSQALCNELLSNTKVKQFISKMVKKHQFEEGALTKLFEATKYNPKIISLMERPAEKKPWSYYRKIFNTETRTSQGREFWAKHESTLKKVEKRFGVPAEIIVAIIGVETKYGRNKGSFPVMEALSTLGFYYPRRSAFFLKELEHFLLFTRENKMDPLSLNGSYAGAMGFPQFMPSSYRAYAIDFSQNGKKDLFNSPADAIASVANYLAKHGWQKDGPVADPVYVQGAQYKKILKERRFKPNNSPKTISSHGVRYLFPENARNQNAALFFLENEAVNEYYLGYKNFYAITRYNVSKNYAMAVFHLARDIKRTRMAELEKNKYS